MLPEDEPLGLSKGWNLAGYLPASDAASHGGARGHRRQLCCVLGFERTGLSYYPDLEPDYNTLQYLEPAAGYSISATQAITLHFPLTVLTNTLPVTGTWINDRRLYLIQDVERQAGVTPTDVWTNLYGRINLPDDRPAPISTTVTIFAGGQPCGRDAGDDRRALRPRSLLPRRSLHDGGRRRPAG